MRRILAAVALSVALVESRDARARDPDALVVVHLSAGISPPDGARLLSAMRAQLQDAARIVVGGDPALAACVVDLDGSDAGTVVRFADRRHGRTSAPRLVPGTGEVGASEVATIVRAFVVAVLDPSHSAGAEGDPAPAEGDAAVATSPRPAAESQGVPPASPAVAEQPVLARHARRWHARVGAAYTAATYASDLVWQSGARIEGAFVLARGFYAGVGYAFHPSSTVVETDATVQIARHSAGVFGGIESSGRTWIFGADIGAAIDETLRSTTTTSSGLYPTGSTGHASPTFALRLHTRCRISESRGLAFDVAPAAEIAPAEQVLVIEGSSGFVTVLSPSVARFRLDIGATFDGF